MNSVKVFLCILRRRRRRTRKLFKIYPGKIEFSLHLLTHSSLLLYRSITMCIYLSTYLSIYLSIPLRISLAATLLLLHLGWQWKGNRDCKININSLVLQKKPFIFSKYQKRKTYFKNAKTQNRTLLSKFISHPLLPSLSSPCIHLPSRVDCIDLPAQEGTKHQGPNYIAQKKLGEGGSGTEHLFQLEEKKAKLTSTTTPFPNPNHTSHLDFVAPARFNLQIQEYPAHNSRMPDRVITECLGGS